MRAFLLLILLALLMGEVSGSLQVGVPSQPQETRTPAPQDENSKVIFAGIVAVALVAVVIGVQQYQRFAKE